MTQLETTGPGLCEARPVPLAAAERPRPGAGQRRTPPPPPAPHREWRRRSQADRRSVRRADRRLRRSQECSETHVRAPGRCAQRRALRLAAPWSRTQHTDGHGGAARTTGSAASATGRGAGKSERTMAVRALLATPASGAQHRRNKSAASDLNQHRPALETLSRRTVGHLRHPGPLSCRIPALLVRVGRGDDLRTPRPALGAVRSLLSQPPALYEPLHLKAAMSREERDVRAGLDSSQQGHITSVVVGRPRLSVRGIIVIQHHDVTQISDRCEHRRPGADHYPRLPAAHPQIRAVPRRRTHIGSQLSDQVGPESGLQRSERGLGIALIGQHHRRTRSLPRVGDSPTVRCTAATICCGHAAEP